MKNNEKIKFICLVRKLNINKRFSLSNSGISFKLYSNKIFNSIKLGF